MLTTMTTHARRLLCAATIVACSPTSQPATDDSTSTTNATDAGQSETGIVTSTSTSTTSTTSTTSILEPTTDDSSTPTGFIVTPDGGGSPNKCDPYAQNCPPGEKCTWWAEGGGSTWNAKKCVPVVDEPAKVNEPCVAEGLGISGIDDCELGTMCWEVDLEGNGVCFALCGGTEEAPTCPPGTGCAVFGDGMAMCFETCDPLAQDCPGGDLCLPVSGTYQCYVDASGDEGQLHDPCDQPTVCDQGLLCVSPTSAIECDPNATGCCEPMCDLDDPDPCPGAGQTCAPVYEPPAQYFEHVGYCTLRE
jgi:hypothetical protein